MSSYLLCFVDEQLRGIDWLRDLYEAYIQNPGIYTSGLVLQNSWDMFRCPPSRGGRSRGATVDLVVFVCSQKILFMFPFQNAPGLLLVWGRVA